MNVRRAVVQAERGLFNTKCGNFVAFEVLILAVVAGVKDHSLATGLIMFAVALVFSWHRALRLIFALLMSAGWGSFTYYVAHGLAPDDTLAWWVGAFIATCLALGAHAAAFDFQDDWRAQS